VTTYDRNNLPRDGKGRIRRTLEGVERDAEACRMYAAGATFQEIADQLGYGDKSNAHRSIQAVLMETIKAPAEELRAREVLRAEEIYVLAREIALRSHPTVSHGKVIYVKNEATGKEVPLIDDAPKLSAMDRMLKAGERLAKLKGLDAPTKFENLTLEAVQAQIAALEAEMGDDLSQSP